MLGSVVVGAAVWGTGGGPSATLPGRGEGAFVAGGKGHAMPADQPAGWLQCSWDGRCTQRTREPAGHVQTSLKQVRISPSNQLMGYKFTRVNMKPVGFCPWLRMRCINITRFYVGPVRKNAVLPKSESGYLARDLSGSWQSMLTSPKFRSSLRIGIQSLNTLNYFYTFSFPNKCPLGTQAFRSHTNWGLRTLKGNFLLKSPWSHRNNRAS